MNVSRPLRPEQPCQRRVHERIPEIGRVQSTGVIQGSKAGHGCSDSEFLVVSRKLLQHLPAISIVLALVLHQSFKPDAAVRAEPTELYLALIVKFDQWGPRII